MRLPSWVRGNTVALTVYLYEPQVDEHGIPERDTHGKIIFIPVDVDAYDEWKVRLKAEEYINIDAEAGEDEGTIVLTIPGCMPCGVYAVEFTGMLNGNAVRSFETTMFAIVESNGNANVTFDVIDGEKSCDVDIKLQLVPFSITRGKNAYELWKELPGNEDKTMQDYIDQVLDLNGITDACITATEAANAAAVIGSHPDYVGSDNYVYHWSNGQYVKTGIYVKGETGPQGPTGADGAAGAAATIAVGSVTTGQPGTNASVTNVGTNSAAVFNFTIPRGEKGATGATGQRGPQGPTGADGAAGAAATIAVGTVATGQPGTNASVTNVGTNSAAVFNFTIPRGDKGEQGAPGSGGMDSLEHWIFKQEGTFLNPTWNTDGHKFSDIADVIDKKTLLVTLRDLDGINGLFQYWSVGNYLLPLNDIFTYAESYPVYTLSNDGSDNIVVTQVQLYMPVAQEPRFENSATSVRSATISGEKLINGTATRVTKVQVDEDGMAVTTSNGATAKYNGNEIATLSDIQMKDVNYSDLDTITETGIYAVTTTSYGYTYICVCSKAGPPGSPFYIQQLVGSGSCKSRSGSSLPLSGGWTDMIPAAQVNSDWNASSGVAQILNKPTIPDVSGLASKVMVVDASTQPTTYNPNTVYELGTLTGTVTINPFTATAADDTEAKIWCLTFSTSTTAPTITWPAAITGWNGGNAPTINASKSYEVSVMDGIGAIIEA